MLLNKHNLNVAKVVSKEESRYTLKAIQCSAEGTVATDGHRLAHVTLPNAKDENFPYIPNFEPSNGHSGTFMLSAKAALDVSKAIPGKSKFSVLQNAAVGVSGPDSETVTLAVTDLDHPRVFTERKVSGQFPNWQMVVPKPEEAKLTIGLNPQYLLDAAKLAIDFGVKVGVKIRLKDANSAITIECTNEETGQVMTQVIMPVRL